MRVQLAAAQFDLENALAELERNGTVADGVRSSLQALGDLQRQIGTASPAALATLRGEIVASANTGRALAQQSRTAASGDSADDLLAAVSARTRATVERIGEDLFEKKIFDPWLQFGSDAERDAYREREAERQEYIRRELAKDTPEGTLNASAAAVGQVLDAEAHGADRSPAMPTTRRDVFAAFGDQRARMIAAGQSTAEADARVANEVRRSLRERGVPDAEIDARLAASSNPLDALVETPQAPQRAAAAPSELDDVAAALRAEVNLHGDREVRNILQARGVSDAEIDARLAASSNPLGALIAALPQRDIAPHTAHLPATAPTGLNDVAAALRAAGVTPPPESASQGHGLAINNQPASERGLG